MYGCESCTVKKAEHWRLDAFELWCWRRLLRVPLDCMEIKLVNSKGNQSWIFIGRTDGEADILATWSSDILATWCEELTHWKRPWCWERLRAGGEGVDRGWNGWMASLIQWTWVLSKLQEMVKDRKACHAAVHGITKSCTQLSDWTTTKSSSLLYFVMAALTN